MKIRMEQEKILNKNYVRIEWQDNTAPYKENILLKKKIPGLIPMDKRCIDNTFYHYYDVTSMRSLQDKWGKEQITWMDVEQIFQSIKTICRQLEEYLLDGSGLCLRPEYIYQEREKRGYYFLYMPKREESIEDMEILTEFMIAHIDEKEEEWNDKLYTFYNEQLLRGQNLTLVEYLQIWQRAEEETSEKEEEEEPPEHYKEAAEDLKWSHELFQTGTVWEKRGKIYRVPFRGNGFTTQTNVGTNVGTLTEERGGGTLLQNIMHGLQE